MKISNFFEESFFINLDKRIERRASFEAEMHRVGVNDFVKRFPAVIDATNLDINDYNRHRACGHSHYSLIKYAKEKNLKNILIFEDDACFYDDGETPGMQIIESALDSLAKVSYWDVFYLGGLLIDSHFRYIDTHLAQVDSVLTTHAWAINNCGYDKLLKYAPATDSAIDGWVANRPEIIKYIAYPLAVPQKAGESDLDSSGLNLGVVLYLEKYKKPIV